MIDQIWVQQRQLLSGVCHRGGTLNIRRWLVCLAVMWFTILPALAQSGSVFLVQLPRKYFSNCMWSTEHLRMGGNQVSTCIMGLGGEHDATMQYELKARYDMFEAMVGFSDSAPDNRAAVFEVWGDGVMLQRMGPLSSGTDPDTIRVPIKGVNILSLRIVPEGYNATHGAVWGDPKVFSGVTKDQFPGSLIVDYNGRQFTGMPNKYMNQPELNLPIPLNPGVREYKVRTEYDQVTGKLKVTTTNLDPQQLPESSKDQQ